MKRILLIMMLGLVMISLASAEQETLGTFGQNDEVSLVQQCGTCTFNNITSIILPNSTRLILDAEMTRRGSEYNYTFNQTDQLGTYAVNGLGDLDNVNTAWAYDFTITSNGKEPPENISTLLSAIFLVVFGVACVFLWISSQTQELGPKLFFFIASLVFITGSIGLAMVVAIDSNVSAAINNTMLAILFSLGMILFIIFAYVLIKQWFTIVEIMRLKKGYSIGNIQQQTYSGYNNQRTWS